MIIAIIIILIILIAILNFRDDPKKCEICGADISKSNKIYKWEMNGKNYSVCYRCNRKLTSKQHKQKFDSFFSDRDVPWDFDSSWGKIETSKKQISNNSRYISTQTKNAVWRRDQGRCVQCGSRENLEYDHIIPVSKGGSSTARNIQLLCEKCNRQKSDKIL